MTSFIIDSHLDRPLAPSWTITDSESDCPFCRIVRGELPAYRILENDKVLAILGKYSVLLVDLTRSVTCTDVLWVPIDILPLRKGHTLVIPKVHQSRISELPPVYAASIGEAVSKVAHALTQGMSAQRRNYVGLSPLFYRAFMSTFYLCSSGEYCVECRV
jgi:diadenosine tetraphosphate (Ap4A) HIT family hydrolase